MAKSVNSSTKNIRKLSIGWQAVFWFTIVFTIVSFISFQIFSYLTINEADRILKQDLTQAMSGIAAQVDIDMLLELAEEGVRNEEGFTDDPRYYVLLDFLDTIHHTDPDMWPYLYIESETEGYVYFVVDLYYLYNWDKAAGFMEHYKSNSGYILLGLEQPTYRAVEAPFVRNLRQTAADSNNQAVGNFINRIADGVSGTWLAPRRDFGTYEDQFGRWASGYMPLETQPGQPRAAIGVDYQAQFVDSLHESVRTRLLQFFEISYILGFLAILLMGDSITRPIIQVIDKAKNVGDSVDPDYFSSGRQGVFEDELDDLEEILSEMVSKIQRRDQRYRAVVSSQTELIVRWAPDGTFTFFNPAYTEYFSRSNDDESSVITFDRIHPSDRATISEFMQNTLPHLTRENPTATIEANFITSKGEQKYIQWQVLAIFNMSGEIEEYQAVGRDITEIKELMERLDFANQQLHGLSHELITEREKDRANLARELHDEVLNYISDLFMTEIETSPEAQENYQLIVDKIRETIYALRPPMLNYGLHLGLDDFVDGLRERYGDDTEIEFDLATSEARFDPDVEIQIYRIVQEATNNALSHAQPTKLWVGGEITPSRVLIELEDDGIGFDPHSDVNAAMLIAHKKFGLMGMQERAKLIGAHLEVNSSRGEGTSIRLEWIPEKAAES